MDVEVIARTDHSARLRTRAIQRNFAAGDGLSGKRARFENACRPKPLVDSDFSRGFLGMRIVHGTALWPNEVGQSVVLKHAIICQIHL